jgi:hypothetical protein
MCAAAPVRGAVAGAPRGERGWAAGAHGNEQGSCSGRGRCKANEA